MRRYRDSMLTLSVQRHRDYRRRPHPSQLSFKRFHPQPHPSPHMSTSSLPTLSHPAVAAADELAYARTDYVSQRNRRDGNKCPSPPGGTDSPPLRSTILGSFFGLWPPPQFFSIAYRRIESQSPPRCTGQRAQPIASSAAQRPHPKLWRCKHVPVQHKDSLAAPPSSLMWRIYLRPRHTPRKSQVRRHTFLRFSLIQGHRRRLPSPAPALLHACLFSSRAC
ncbi:hypothetical protein R3P38DRAFT_1631553 [Favolaschia claudopus]|uniref:Uncharacterized protein n=1 Tax=Favolaschia claudopus TaxID=2862362 RepID=A0AAW0DLU5_9AGAR